MAKTKQNGKRRVRDITIKLTPEEIAAVRDITLVDAVAPGVVQIVRRAIAEHQRNKG